MNYKFIMLPMFLFATIGYNFSQSLFESSVNKPDEERNLNIDFNGYGRGSAYGGSKFYDYSSVFAEFGIQGKLSVNSVFLFADLRFRAGTQYDSLYATIQMKETYVGYQSNKFDVYFAILLRVAMLNDVAGKFVKYKV